MISYGALTKKKLAHVVDFGCKGDWRGELSEFVEGKFVTKISFSDNVELSFESL